MRAWKSYHPRMDAKLLELLVCPVTKGPLIYQRETQELVSRSARLAYPVRDGIPVMLENEARSVDPDAIVPPPVFPAPAPNAPDTP